VWRQLGELPSASPPFCYNFNRLFCSELEDLSVDIVFPVPFVVQSCLPAIHSENTVFFSFFGRVGQGYRAHLRPYLPSAGRKIRKYCPDTTESPLVIEGRQNKGFCHAFRGPRAVLSELSCRSYLGPTYPDDCMLYPRLGKLLPYCLVESLDRVSEDQWNATNGF
jgi:hypothetical protein